jgi:hypothetical protein
MPGVRVGDDRIHREGADGGELLALHALRRGVEPGAPGRPFDAEVVR